MRFDEVIYLLSGKPANAGTTQRKVFANKWTIGGDWIGSNGIEGLEDVLAFEIIEIEYKREKYASYNSKFYRIVNASIRGERAILTLEYDA